MRIYLAGPMRGLPDFNYPAFNSAAGRLRRLGHTVFNPAETTEAELYAATNGANYLGEVQKGWSIRDYMLVDTAWICRHAEAVALLPGWDESTGARAEKALAQCIGAKVLYVGVDI